MTSPTIHLEPHDLQGKRYGKLVVLGTAGRYGATKLIGLMCRCECGNLSIVRTAHLIAGRQVSCGCYSRQNVMDRAESLLGKKFGRLTVVDEGERAEPPHQVRQWVVQCDCGNVFVTPGGNLRSGHTRSCGCWSRELTAARNSRPPQEWTVVGDRAECKLGKHVVTIDADDLPLVQNIRWAAKNVTYGGPPYIYDSKGKTLMARLLLGDGLTMRQVVDYADTNTLNLRRANIRAAHRSDDLGNARKHQGALTSSFKGVWATGDRWKASVQRGGETHYLGTFDTEKDAAKAYDRKAAELFGEFARTNAMIFGPQLLTT